MSIVFYGNKSAELFTRQLAHSIEGTLKHNFIADGTAEFPVGFVRASKPGNVWDDTCWTRDSGAYLRELALYGFVEEAAMIARYLMSHVQRDALGHYAFPMYFRGSEIGTGGELDGTCSICTGLMELHACLDPGIVKCEIEEFLLCGDSPLRGVLEGGDSALVAGSGEFGGGWCVDGSYINVVQNAMLASSLHVFAKFSAPFDASISDAASIRKKEILKSMLTHMTAPDGGWVWAIEPESHLPLNMDKLLHAKGTAMINGVAPALFDAFGYDALIDPDFAERCRKTARRIVTADPLRRRLYDTYGMIGFVHEMGDAPDACAAYASWLGYCDCFFAETAVLLRDVDALTRSLDWITTATLFGGNPPAPPEDILAELSALPEEPFRHWFAERNYAPDWQGERPEGCGTLNLIHVAECMRLARMMAGVHNVREAPVHPPFLPRGYSVS